MSRIRSVHPGLASDEAYMSMSFPAKAAWPLLWTECDDHGMFEWKPIVLKARIFPADNVDFATILSELEELGCIKRVEVEGKSFGLVRNFCTYQRPKNPSYRFAFPEGFRKFVGLKDAEGDSPTPVLPQPSPSPTEKPPQMKEEGGRMEDEGGSVVSAQTPKVDPLAHLTDRMLAAAKLDSNLSMRDPRLANIAPALGVIEAGYDVDRDLLPAISLKAASGFKFKSWSLLPQIVAEFVEKRDGAKAFAPRQAADPPNWPKRMAAWREHRVWAQGWGPQPDEAGCQCPPELLEAA